MIELLNSRASQEDLENLKFEKTNKTDTDLVMKNIDIIHKQIVQMSTVLMESIKHGIVTKFESETEKQ